MLQSRVVAIRTFAMTLDPDRYETHDGHLLLLDDLRASPLGKLPIPDAAHKIKHYYKDFRRRKGETVGALLIREQDCYSEMATALERLLEEMDENKQYKCCAQCEGYFDGTNGGPGNPGRWYCTRCWSDYWATTPAAKVRTPEQSATTLQDTRQTQVEAVRAEGIAAEDEERWVETDSVYSQRSRHQTRERQASATHAIEVGTTQVGQVSRLLKVLRGFFLLEAMNFTEKEKQDVRVVTQNRLDFDAISKALKERWEDKALVQRDFGPRVMPQYGAEAGPQAASYTDPEEDRDSDWYEGWAAAMDDQEWWPEEEFPDENQAESEGQPAPEPEGTELLDYDEMHQLEKELEAAKLMAAETSRTLAQVRQAVAAAYKDRGRGRLSGPSPRAPRHLHPSWPDQSFVPFNKGGKSKDGKGDWFGKDRKSKGKGKSDGKNNAHYMDFHMITPDLDELQHMMGATSTTAGLSPSEVRMDRGAPVLAGREQAVQNLVAAAAAANPFAQIHIDKEHHRWFRVKDSQWGQAVYQVSVTLATIFILEVFALRPVVPMVLLGMKGLEQWSIIADFQTGDVFAKGRQFRLRKTLENGHYILDMVRHARQILASFSSMSRDMAGRIGEWVFLSATADATFFHKTSSLPTSPMTSSPKTSSLPTSPMTSSPKTSSLPTSLMAPSLKTSSLPTLPMTSSLKTSFRTSQRTSSRKKPSPEVSPPTSAFPRTGRCFGSESSTTSISISTGLSGCLHATSLVGGQRGGMGARRDGRSTTGRGDRVTFGITESKIYDPGEGLHGIEKTEDGSPAVGDLHVRGQGIEARDGIRGASGSIIGRTRFGVRRRDENRTGSSRPEGTSRPMRGESPRVLPDNQHVREVASLLPMRSDPRVHTRTNRRNDTQVGEPRAAGQLLTSKTFCLVLAGLVAAACINTVGEAVETCCTPKRTLIAEARNIGITMERISIENGFNLSTLKMKELQPRRAWISLPCTLWSPLTYFPTDDSKRRLDRDRQRDRRRGSYGLHLIRLVVDDGREVHFEWTHRGHGWHTPELKWFRKELGRRRKKHYEDILDGCMLDLRDPYTNKPLSKNWCILTTDLDSAKVAVTCDSSRDHQPIEGWTTGTMAFYPQALCRAVSKFRHTQLRKPKDLNVAFESSEANQIKIYYKQERLDWYMIAESDKEKVCAMLHRIHESTGHPSDENLTYWVFKLQCPAWVIEEAKNPKCETCDIKHGNRMNVKASPDIPMAPWQATALDVFDLPFPDKDKKVRFFLIAEVATGLMVGDVAVKTGLKNDSVEKLFQVFSKTYLKHHPRPKWILVDPHRSFVGGKFNEYCHLACVGVSVTSGQAHWMAGDIKWRVSTIKQALRKRRIQHSKTESEVLFYFAFSATNNVDQVKGFTPTQWVFGYALTDSPILAHNAANGNCKADFLETKQVRADVEATYLKENAARKITELKPSAPRPSQIYHRDGLVCVLRTMAAAGRRKHAETPTGDDYSIDGMIIGPGMVLFAERAVLPGSKEGSFWVVMDTRRGRCAAEQLRSTTKSEIMQIELKPYDMLNFPLEDLWLNLAHCDDTAGESRPGTEQLHRLPKRPRNGQISPAEPEDTTMIPDATFEADPDTQQEQFLRRRRTIEAEAYPPRFGSSSTLPSGRSTLFSGSRYEAYNQEYAPHFHEFSDQVNTNEHELMTFVQDRFNGDQLDPLKIEIHIDLEELCFDVDAYLEKQLNRGAAHKKDIEVFVNRLTDPERTLFQEVTAQELACHRKIPLVKMASAHAGYEYNKNISKFKFNKNISKDKLDKNISKDELIKMCWLLTWKHLTPPDFPAAEDSYPDDAKNCKSKAKACIILPGFSYLDLVERDELGFRVLTTASPTISRKAKLALLQLAVCYGWKLEFANAKSVLLQAGHTEEWREIYTMVVKKPCAALGVDEGEVLRILTAIYGIMNSPWVFWKYVDKVIHKISGKGVTIELCVWIILELLTGELAGAIDAHVDDLGFPRDRENQNFFNVRETQRQMLRRPLWQPTPCKWTGGWITQDPDDKIYAGQKKHFQELVDFRLDAFKCKCKEVNLQPDDVTQFREVLMQCKRRATQIALQFSCRVVLLPQRANEATVLELMEVNSLICDVKHTVWNTLVFHMFDRYSHREEPLEWHDMLLTTWVDASRLPQRGSYIVDFFPPDIWREKEFTVPIVDWQSYKHMRTGTGTNGCTGQTLYDGENAAYQMRLLWAALLGVLFMAQQQEALDGHTQSVLIRDSHGICVAVHNKESFGIGWTDSRTGAEILHVKASCGSGSFGTTSPSCRHLRGRRRTDRAMRKRRDNSRPWSQLMSAHF